MKEPKDRKPSDVASDLMQAAAWAKKHRVKKLPPDSAVNSYDVFMSKGNAARMLPIFGAGNIVR